MNNNQKLGDRMRELRIQKGHLSVEKFTFDNDISRVLYCNYESGKGNPTYKNIVKVCQALEISLAEFFQPFNEI